MRRLVYLTLFCLLICLLTGCGHARPTAAQATGNAIARAQSRNDSIGTQADKIAATSNGDTRVRAETIQSDVTAQRKDLAEAQGSLNDLAKQLASVLASWAYKIGTFIVRCWWMFLLGVVLAIALRSAALLMTGPAGAGVSVASHVLLGVATGGASVIHSILDNVFWRRVKPTPVVVVEPAPPVETAPVEGAA